MKDPEDYSDYDDEDEGGSSQDKFESDFIDDDRDNDRLNKSSPEETTAK